MVLRERIELSASPVPREGSTTELPQRLGTLARRSRECAERCRCNRGGHRWQVAKSNRARIQEVAWPPAPSEQAGVDVQNVHLPLDAHEFEQVEPHLEGQLRLRRAFSPQMAADAAHPVGHFGRYLHR